MKFLHVAPSFKSPFPLVALDPALLLYFKTIVLQFSIFLVNIGYIVL